MPASTLPPIGRSSAAAIAGCGGRRGDGRDGGRAANPATSSNTAAPSSRTIGATWRARLAVTAEPTIAPIVAPAAMKPNRRFPCSGLNKSTFSPEQRSEEHTSELQSPDHIVCPLLLEKKKNDKLSCS